MWKRLIPIVLLLAISIAQTFAIAGQPKLLVFTAASMKEAVSELALVFERSCSCTVRVSDAATSVLARQIDAGAPADVFIAANPHWMRWLGEKGRAKANEVKVIARNNLVIAVMTADATLPAGVEVLASGRFAMADALSVPAGIYAKSALEGLGIWKHVEKNAVFTENVRVALSMVASGTLRSAIVYGSDLMAETGVSKHYQFNQSLHDPIEYLAAPIGEGNAQAVLFVEFLGSADARAVFEAHGFFAEPTPEVVN